MSWVLITYFVSMLGPIGSVLGLTIAAVVIFSGIIGARALLDESAAFIEDGRDKYIGWLKRLLVGLGALVVMLVVVPSEDTAKLMVGAYVAQESVLYMQGVEGMEELPKNIVDAANTFFESMGKKVDTVTETVTE